MALPTKQTALAKLAQGDVTMAMVGHFTRVACEVIRTPEDVGVGVPVPSMQGEVHPHTMLSDFVMRLAEKRKMPAEILLTALVFLERLRGKLDFRAGSSSQLYRHRIVLATLIIADKTTSDDPGMNVEWEEQASLFALADINRTEIQVLNCLDYRTCFSDADAYVIWAPLLHQLENDSTMRDQATDSPPVTAGSSLVLAVHSPAVPETHEWQSRPSIRLVSNSRASSYASSVSPPMAYLLNPPRLEVTYSDVGSSSTGSYASSVSDKSVILADFARSYSDLGFEPGLTEDSSTSSGSDDISEVLSSIEEISSTSSASSPDLKGGDISVYVTPDEQFSTEPQALDAFTLHCQEQFSLCNLTGQPFELELPPPPSQQPPMQRKPSFLVPPGAKNDCSSPPYPTMVARMRERAKSRQGIAARRGQMSLVIPAAEDPETVGIHDA